MKRDNNKANEYSFYPKPCQDTPEVTKQKWNIKWDVAL